MKTAQICILLITLAILEAGASDTVSLNPIPDTTEKERIHFWGGVGLGGIPFNDIDLGATFTYNRNHFTGLLAYDNTLSDNDARTQIVGISAGPAFYYKNFYFGVSGGGGYAWGETQYQDEDDSTVSEDSTIAVNAFALVGKGYILFAPLENVGFGLEPSLTLYGQEDAGGAARIRATVNIGRFGESYKMRYKPGTFQKRWRRTFDMAESNPHNTLSIGFRNPLDQIGRRGISMVWDHTITNRMISLGGEVDWLYRRETIQTDSGTILEKVMHFPLIFRFGFHPFYLQRIQERMSFASQLDPYLVIGYRHIFTWYSKTINDVTTTDWDMTEGPAGGIMSLYEWLAITGGLRWYFHQRVGLWSEINWHRGVIGVTFKL